MIEDLRSTRRGYLRATGVTAGVATMGVGSATAKSGNGQLVMIYDDGPQTDFTKAFPVHQDEGVPACSACIAGAVRDESDYYMSPDQMVKLEKGGWEIMSHSLHHCYLGSRQIARDIVPSDTRIYFSYPVLGNFKGFLIQVSDGNKKRIVKTEGKGEDSKGKYVQLKHEVGASFSASKTSARYTDKIIHEALSKSKKILKQKGASEVKNFIYPHGGHGPYVDSQMSKYYNGVGNFHLKGISPRHGFNPYRTCRQQFVPDAMSSSELSSYMDQIVNGDKLGVLGAHTWKKSLTQKRIRKVIRMAKTRDIEIITFQQAVEDNAKQPVSTTSTPTPTSSATSTPTPTPTPTPTATSTATPTSTSTRVGQKTSAPTTHHNSGGGLFSFLTDIERFITNLF